MSDWRRPRFSIGCAMAVLLFACLGEAQTTPAPRCGTGVHEAEAEGAVLFPQDQIFCPSPYGQFFQDDISYVGVGLHFGL